MKAITYIKQNLSRLNPRVLNQLLENEGSTLTEELWAYLSETSGNTNPAILWSEFRIDVDENGDSRPIDWYIWLENYSTHVELNYISLNREYPVGKYYIETDGETGDSKTTFVEEWPEGNEFKGIRVTTTENEDIYEAEVLEKINDTWTTSWTVAGANGYFPNPALGELIYYGADNFDEGYVSDKFFEIFGNACNYTIGPNNTILNSENPIYLVFNGIVMESQLTSEQSVEFNNGNERYSISKETDAETGVSRMIMHLPGKCAIYGSEPEVTTQQEI